MYVFSCLFISIFVSLLTFFFLSLPPSIHFLSQVVNYVCVGRRGCLFVCVCVCQSLSDCLYISVFIYVSVCAYVPLYVFVRARGKTSIDRNYE